MLRGLSDDLAGHPSLAIHRAPQAVTQYIVDTAILIRVYRNRPCRHVIFSAFLPVGLASHSTALTVYENISTN